MVTLMLMILIMMTTLMMMLMLTKSMLTDWPRIDIGDSDANSDDHDYDDDVMSIIVMMIILDSPDVDEEMTREYHLVSSQQQPPMQSPVATHWLANGLKHQLY